MPAIRKVKTKKPRVQLVVLSRIKVKIGEYWSPSLYDKKDRFIPTSVDCLFNIEYFSKSVAAAMTKSL